MKKSFILNNVKAMIKKYQLPTSFSLRVKPMKEEYVKCVRDGAIVAPSVAGNTEDENGFQRINRKANKHCFKSKKSVTNKSKFSRTILGGHLNEEKMTRCMKTEVKKKLLMGRILNSDMEESMDCARTKIVHSSLFIGSQRSDQIYRL